MTIDGLLTTIRPGVVVCRRVLSCVAAAAGRRSGAVDRVHDGRWCLSQDRQGSAEGLGCRRAAQSFRDGAVEDTGSGEISQNRFLGTPYHKLWMRAVINHSRFYNLLYGSLGPFLLPIIIG